MNPNDFYAIKFENDTFSFLDQTQLPFEEKYIETTDYRRVATAIERLEVRGAPQIGIAAAYGLVLALKEQNDDDMFHSAYERLLNTRPTAVNLQWALQEMKQTYDNSPDGQRFTALQKKAADIHQDDFNKCDNIAKNALPLFDRKKRVLTHCNAGALATGGDGTALGVIKKAFQEGLIAHVYADETRPLLQGSRLTAYELHKSGIPFSIQPDSAAAMLMRKGKVDIVITGADRITSRGDTANKIGTYMLAILALYHKIPFYIAAPTSTIDVTLKRGREIPIEERDAAEVHQIRHIPVTSADYPIFNPAFDVTPAELITGIITEEKLYSPPYNFT